jgi:hypothetical protein
MLDHPLRSIGVEFFIHDDVAEAASDLPQEDVKCSIA